MSLGNYADTYRPQYRGASAVVPMASDLGDSQAQVDPNTPPYVSTLAVFAAVVGLWILPVIILWDEVRKFLIRLDPKKEKGIVGRITYF